MSDRALARVLGLRDLILIVVGTVIGSGIFLVPGGVVRQTAGYAGPALVVWVVGGVLSLLGALAYGELGAMNPAAGGLYVYLRDAFGPITAFLYGWTFFLVIATGSAATLAVASSAYLQQFVALGPIGQKATAVMLLAIVAVINVRSTRGSADVQNWTTAIKVGALLVMSVFLVAFGSAARQTLPFWPPAFTSEIASGMGLGMIGVLWAYEGWQYVTFSAGEATSPQRTFPRAIVIGTASLIGIYVFANIGYLAALGADGVAGSDRVAAEAVSRVAGGGAGKLIAAAILVSIFSATNGLTISAPRVYYAMARDRLFFRSLAAVHPRFGTPAASIVAGTVWAMVLAVSGTFEQLLTYVVFVGWIFYGLGAACVFALRRAHPDANRPFRVPGYPWAPLLFIVAAAALVANTIATQPGRAAIGIGVVLLGLPVYFVWQRRPRQSLG
ncbi:MAG TPA: amino acid permease [Vicinamibacterales bacterium]|nr:amino acid permease [Vicinamibacterales bacterium]